MIEENNSPGSFVEAEEPGVECRLPRIAMLNHAREAAVRRGSARNHDPGITGTASKQITSPAAK
jgi:hypothetical protein